MGYAVGMSVDHQEQRSLEELFERPDPALAIRLAPAARSRHDLLAELDGRRLVAAALVAPLLWFAYTGSAGSVGDVAGGPVLWYALLALTTAIGALVVATYVPRRGVKAVGSPCAALAGLYVLFAAWALDTGTATLGGVLLALGLVSFGLFQRLRGPGACGV